MAKSPDFGRWRRTTPFAIVFFIRDTISQVNTWGQLLASFGLAALLVRARPLLARVLPAAILLTVAVAVLRYWFFRFRLEEDRILIRKGVLRKTSIDLPLDRVQGINLDRSLTDRVLGLVTVKVDTAGSDGVEARIPSVQAAFADQLRAKVGVARGEGPAVPGVEGDAGDARGEAPATGPRDSAESSKEVIMKLPAGDMVRIGLQLVSDALLPVIAIGFVADLRGVLRYVAGQYGILEPIGREQVPLDYATGLADLSLRAGIVAGVVALIAAGGIYSACKNYYGFTLFRERTAYRTRGGLFSLKEVVVQSAKIQQVRLSQNLVARCFRRFRLSIHAASDDVDVLVVPLLRARMAEALRSEVFGREGGGLTLLPRNRALVRVSPQYIRARALKIGIAPAVALPVLAFALEGPSVGWAEFSAIWILLSLLVSGLIALQSWRRLGYVHDDDGMAIRSGFVESKVDAFLFRKAQSVKVTRSPLQRRKGLATLEVGLASEVLRVPYIDHGLACRLRDYILYKVETNHRWH